MLKPSMQELMKQVGNRYLLVNLAAQRARDIADQANEAEEPIDEKTVQLALDEIAEGSIVYRPGPRVEPIFIPNHGALAAVVDVDDVEGDMESMADESDADLFDAEGLDDGDIPEEDR